MSNHFLVVIGSVTEREYTPVRQEILNLGKQPKVVRITDKQIRTIVESFCTATGFGERSTSRDDFEKSEDYGEYKLLRRIVERVAGFKLSGYYSLVFSEQAWKLCRVRRDTDVKDFTISLALELMTPQGGHMVYVVRGSRPQSATP